MQENLNLCLNSSKMIGCVIVNITAPLIQEKRAHIILGLLWQIIRSQAESKINLHDNPYLIRLKHENEEIGDLLKLSPEQLLLRWFNYHLEKAGSTNRVKNFSADVKDGENYTLLLN